MMKFHKSCEVQVYIYIYISTMHFSTTTEGQMNILHSRLTLSLKINAQKLMFKIQIGFR